MCLFEYYINEYHFKCKGELDLVVLSRTKETAFKIVDILNKRYPNHPPFKPKKIGFVKYCVTCIPPYELEQQGFEYAKTWKRSSFLK